MQEPRAWTITLMFFFFSFLKYEQRGGGGGGSRLCIFRFLLCMITDICVIDTTMGTEQDKVQSDARTCAHIVLLLPFDQKDRTIAQSECDEYSWVEIISMVGLNLQLQGKVHHPNPSCLLHLILTCLAQQYQKKKKWQLQDFQTFIECRKRICIQTVRQTGPDVETLSILEQTSMVVKLIFKL